MTVRKALYVDLPRLLEIYEIAKVYMRNTGNPTQWDSSYPGEAMLRSDIQKGGLYVVENDNEIHACFLLVPGPDPTYARIDGEWLCDCPYCVIHRIASDGKVRGVLKTAIALAKEKAPSLRIDTHSDNSVMQSLLLKNGFTYCGIIYLENGDPRLAYQQIF